MKSPRFTFHSSLFTLLASLPPLVCPQPPHGLPIGEWYETAPVVVNRNGGEVRVLRRVPRNDAATARGWLNVRLARLKADNPDREIRLVASGDAAQAVREAGNVWSVTVVEPGEESIRERLNAAPPAASAAWRGRRVAFLGDSITDARHIGCASNYWNYLARDLALTPLVYGINGHQWSGLVGQVERLFAEHPNDVDEICLFAGTNDYNASVPLGEWTDGVATFRGRVATVLRLLTRRFPAARLWLMTPIHRGYATFGARNVQPDETHANALGLWLDDYVAALKEAAAKWPAVHLIDLHAESGLYPLAASHLKFFHDATTDRLHPNSAGHERMAAVITRHFLSADETPALQARLAALPPEGGTIRLAPGVHHFYDASARTMRLNPSNNRSGEKRVVAPLVSRRNVTIDGGGSTLVFHGRAFPFAATNCANVTFRDFTVTTRFPSCAGFVVTEKNDGGFTVRFDDGVAPFAVGDGALAFSLDGHAVSTRDGRLSLHALDRLVIIYLMTPTSPGDKSTFPAGFVGVTPEAVDARTVRFTYTGDTHPKSIRLPYDVGERVVVNLEEKRERDVFFFEDCDGVRVENVLLRRFGGMGIVGQRSGNIAVERLLAEPHDGERVTLTADIIQFINCFGDVSIRDCSGGHSLDDWLNIHGNYLSVEAARGDRLRLKTRHGSHHGFFPYRSGDTLELVTAHERAVRATLRVRAVMPDPADPSLCTVVTDRDVGDLSLVGLLVENVTLNPNVTIAGNRFCDYPNIRLSGRGRYVIEGNRFERCCTAVTGLDLADYWFESGRILDMLIRRNAVVNGGGFRFGVSGWNDANTPKIHGRIRLEANTFDRVGEPKYRALGVRDFSVR